MEDIGTENILPMTGEGGTDPVRQPILPLVWAEVEMYFSQKGIPLLEAADFYERNKDINWLRKRGGWKKAAHQVIQRILRERPWLFDRRTIR